MKHRLSALLNGMEMTRSEHDWLEQRFDNMTAKEELLFRGAVGIEHPEALQDAIQILQSLEHYRLLYGADDDVTLGRFVMEHIHSPTPAARAYAHDGFGCSPHAIGRSIRCTCLGDGEHTRWNRADFIGVLKDEFLPDWAKEKLEQLSATGHLREAPSMSGMSM